MRRVGTAHHYRVCADTPYSRSKGEGWIDRMITQRFFRPPPFARGEGWGTHAIASARLGRRLALPLHDGT
jgi:hypothetical protein